MCRQRDREVRSYRATLHHKTDLVAMREQIMHQRIGVSVIAVVWGLTLVAVAGAQESSPSGTRGTRPLGPAANAGRDSGREGSPARQAKAAPTGGNTRPQQSAAPPAGGPSEERMVHGPPTWWPLRPDHETYLDEILDYWEYNTAKIQRYECKFTRWIYDPAAVRPDPQTGELPAREISQGVIKYMTPASAMYKVDKVYGYVPPAEDQGSRYDELDAERFGEHWVCDGQSIFEFDYGQKLLKQIVLPPEAQGEAISKGPLPFLFRAKKDEIKERFWIRVITPEGKTGEYWLEAYPRTQEDAAHFKFIHIIIDQKEFLPKALILFKRTFSERSPARETFAFEDRQVNLTWKNFLQGLNIWKRDFFAPAVPDGWKKVVQQVEAGPAGSDAGDVPPGGSRTPAPPGAAGPAAARPVQAAQPGGNRTSRAPGRTPDMRR
jgi:TIGR03009 family protein